MSADQQSEVVSLPSPEVKSATSRPDDGPVQVLKPYGVGIDTHSKFIAVCVMRQKGGAVVKSEGQFSTEWKSLLEGRDWITSALDLPKAGSFWEKGNGRERHRCLFRVWQLYCCEG
jgi:hypothetical protein